MVEYKRTRAGVLRRERHTYPPYNWSNWKCPSVNACLSWGWHETDLDHGLSSGGFSSELELVLTDKKGRRWVAVVGNGKNHGQIFLTETEKLGELVLRTFEALSWNR